MQWYEAEVRALELKTAGLGKNGTGPVFYGSSSIRLWDTLPEDIGPAVLNLGFGGSTLEACDYFFTRLVPPAQPSSLLVYAGDNDLGDGRSVEAVVKSYHSLAAKVAASLGEIPFGFVSIKPSPARYPLLDRIRRVNQIVRDEIEMQKGGYFVDIFSDMVDDRGRPKGEYFVEDGLHLNRDGYLLWTQLLQPYRNRIFTE